MAGVGKNAIIIDGVAAARKILGANPQVRAETGSTPVHEAGPGTCALGHENPEGTRFCGQCGLPAGGQAPAAAVVDAGPPKPAAMLTPAEREERERQHVEAVAALRRAEEQVPDIDQQADPSAKKILIHFVGDGFTWAGRVWYRGDQLEIGPEHPRWDSAVGWITLDKVQQVQRYGRVIFDTGPWPYAQIPPGAEVPLPTADYHQVFGRPRGGAPAQSGEAGSLVPR